jgi:hypothetical protein
MSYYITILILVIFCLLAGLAFNRMMKDTHIIYDGLDKLDIRAREKGLSREQLIQIYEDLRTFSKKYCWHKYHAARVREIAAYLRGRLE